MSRITTFVMFQGQAEKAIDLYSSVFSDFQVKQVEKYGVGDDGLEGQIKRATVDFDGQNVILLCHGNL